MNLIVTAFFIAVIAQASLLIASWLYSGPIAHWIIDATCRRLRTEPSEEVVKVIIETLPYFKVGFVIDLVAHWWRLLPVFVIVCLRIAERARKHHG